MDKMPESIRAIPITSEAFSPFGDLLELGTVEPKLINEGRCKRYTDLAQLDVQDNQTGISLFHADIRELPYQLTLLERHPLGSQAFIPMAGSTFMVIVANDKNDKPNNPQAFMIGTNQGINIHRNVWHGVLTPLSGNGLFTVIDYVGDRENLEEFRLAEPIMIFSD